MAQTLAAWQEEGALLRDAHPALYALRQRFAAPDGSDVRNEGGQGAEIPQAAQDAKKLNECISAAAGDPDKIFSCFDQF